MVHVANDETQVIAAVCCSNGERCAISITIAANIATEMLKALIVALRTPITTNESLPTIMLIVIGVIGGSNGRNNRNNGNETVVAEVLAIATSAVALITR